MIDLCELDGARAAVHIWRPPAGAGRPHALRRTRVSTTRARVERTCRMRFAVVGALVACAALAHAAAAPASADAGRAELLLAQRELASNLASRRRLLDKKEFAADKKELAQKKSEVREHRAETAVQKASREWALEARAHALASAVTTNHTAAALEKQLLETREALLWSVHELARTRTRSHELFGQIHDLADVGENAMSSNRSTMVEQEGDRYVAEAQGFMHALGATFGVILATEIGDKTFFIAAVLVMRHSRLVVWSGAVGALAVMTILSAVVGHAAPLLLPPSLTHYAAVLLFFIFGAQFCRAILPQFWRNSGAILAQFCAILLTPLLLRRARCGSVR